MEQDEIQYLEDIMEGSSLIKLMAMLEDAESPQERIAVLTGITDTVQEAIRANLELLS